MADIRTEVALKTWRNGPLLAERLCAGILSIEGYESIDPQAPLGGADGLKDVICRRNGKKFIGASYFPPTHKTFADIKEKFIGDLAGVAQNNAQGFAFFVNHDITLGNRKILEDIAKEKKCILQLYHLERIRSLLDSPSGHGFREQFLDITMTPEEFAAMHGYWQKNFSDAINLYPTSEFLMEQVGQTISTFSQLTIAHHDKHLQKNMKEIMNFKANHQLPVTSHITIRLLLFVHKIVAHDRQLSGKLRNVPAWVSAKGKSIEEALYIPPHADKVPAMLADLFDRWNSKFGEVYHKTKSKKILAIASFHIEFLSIHPFVDGNGRVARLLMDQQIEDLLHITTHIDFTKRKVTYLDSIQTAQRGDIRKFYSLLKEEIEKPFSVS